MGETGLLSFRENSVGERARRAIYGRKLLSVSLEPAESVEMVSGAKVYGILGRSEGVRRLAERMLMGRNGTGRPTGELVLESGCDCPSCSARPRRDTGPIRSGLASGYV